MKNIDLFENPSSSKLDIYLDKLIFKRKFNDADCGYLTGSYDFQENTPWVQTYSGRRFNPLKPIPESIVIQDVAHALSQVCRYNGQCNFFFSVAQHCVIVSYLCDEKDALHGLLHDLSEFVISDISAPLKHTSEFEEYRRIEDNLMRAAYKRFGLIGDEPTSVKRADKLALATEVASGLLDARPDWKLPCQAAPFKIVPLPPDEAKILFLNRFFDLIGKPDLKSKYHKGLDKLSNEEIKEYLYGK